MVDRKRKVHLGTIKACILLHYAMLLTMCKGKGLIVGEIQRDDLFRINIETEKVTQYNFSGIDDPIDIDIDVDGSLIFWTEWSSEKVYRANLDGTNATIILSLPESSNPVGIALDPLRKRVYYTDQELGLISSCDYNGNDEHIIHTGLDKPDPIVLDINNRIIYWAERGEKPGIMASSYTGGYRMTIVNNTVLYPYALAFDPESQTLFWCDNGLKRIESIKSDGTKRRLLAQEASAGYTDLTIHGEYIYITDWSIKNLKRLPKAGGEIETIGPEVFGTLYCIASTTKTSNTYITDISHIPSIESDSVTSSITPNEDSKSQISIFVIIVLAVGILLVIVMVIALGIICLPRNLRLSRNVAQGTRFTEMESMMSR